MSHLQEAALVAPPPPPYHVLMTNDNDANSPRTRRRMVLDRRLKRDYLARRYRAFQEAKGAGTTTEDPFWNGASPLEKSLTACCWSGYEEQDDNDDDDDNNNDEDDLQHPGALKRDKIVTFVGLLALHCHDVGSRALALAILERTQEADAFDEEIIRAAANTEQPPVKRQRLDDDVDGDGDESPDNSSSSPVECMSPSVVHVQTKQKPPRLAKFVKAGGLRLLSRWLVDASTPVPAPKAAPSKQQQRRPSHPPAGGSSSSAAAAAKVASPTGPLLLPLLLLLQKLPFDRQAITQSQINKKIKRLSKELDVILPAVQDAAEALGGKPAGTSSAVEARTDPVAGGLPIRQVQVALADTMKTWNEHSNKEQKSTTAATEEDPFAALKAKLQDRLKDLEADETNNAPPWLVKVRAVQKQQSSQKSASSSSSAATSQQKIINMSTKERERKERENERTEMMKKDLEKAQIERRQLLRKLRSLQHNETAAATCSNNFAPPPSTRRKGVRWKDGFGAASKMRKRELLEEVHVFTKDKDVLAAAAKESNANNEELFDSTATTTVSSETNSSSTSGDNAPSSAAENPDKEV